MQWRHHIPFLIQASINTLCLALLLLWTWHAIEKYASQPISTSVSFSKGEGNGKIKFPHLTFCTQDEWGFIHKMHEKLTNDANFDTDAYLLSTTLKMKSFVIEAMLTNAWRTNETITELIYPVFNGFFGPCIGFNPENLSRSTEQNDAFTTHLLFFLNGTSLTHDFPIWLFLHSHYDAADAMDTSPIVGITKGKLNYQGMRLKGF